MKEIAGYEFIHTRRDGSDLYRSQDNKSFMKIWDHDAITHEYDLYSLLQINNVRVPKIMKFDKISSDTSRLIEMSLWDKSFKDLIMENTSDSDIVVPWKIFDKLIESAEKFLNEKRKIDILSLTSQSLNDPFQEVINEWLFDSWYIKEVQQKMEDWMRNVPKIWCHWDYTIFNIFPEWVIDLEDSRSHYFGYDIVSLLTHTYRFPTHQEAERIRLSTFSSEQVEKGLSKLLDTEDFYTDDVFAGLFLLRWFWAVQRMQKTPLLQTFRKNLLKKVGDIYLSWWDVKKFVLDTFNTY